MRIVHVNTEVSLRGGEAQLLLLLEGLKEKGHKNFLIVDEKSPLMKKAGLMVDSVLMIKSRRVFDILNILRIYQFIKSLHPHILHLHTSYAHTIGGIAGRLAGIPIIVTRRVAFPIRNSFKYNHFCDGIIAISEAIKKLLIKKGVKEEKIVVIPSGIDIKRFDSIGNRFYLYKELKVPPKSLMIGTIAHLSEEKGHIYLLEAIPLILKEFPESFFLFIGEGGLKKSLKKKAEDLQIARRVIFTGFREDIPEILSILDLFILPSSLEGLGTSLMDALYMKVPVVATLVGGIPEVIENGRTGLLVPPKNPKALSDAVIQLLRDKPKRKKFSWEGGRKVLGGFTSSVMIERTEQFYHSLTKSHPLRYI